jgi:hypothetical protein
VDFLGGINEEREEVRTKGRKGEMKKVKEDEKRDKRGKLTPVIQPIFSSFTEKRESFLLLCLIVRPSL